ncbi:MAG: hypothetical protein JJE39_17110 [Vicinamibacteria bacterium]|nr:hypothetical protein [Vicinamibacteria bacterium]
MLIALALAITAAPSQGAVLPSARRQVEWVQAQGLDGQAVDGRRLELQRFSARLEQNLAAACRPAEPMVFMSGLPETRFVYLDGVGAIFLLPARSLPNPPTPRPDQPAPELSVSRARHGSSESPRVLVIQRPSDLTDLEARIRETRKEAERMRAQADVAFADAERQLMAELRPGLSESGVTTSFPVPWTLFLEDMVEDSRPSDQVEKDVKDALVATIIENSTLLKSLQPAEMVTASVDLVSRPQPWVRAKPARTVVVRAKKADLDAFVLGRLSKDDLLKLVQTKAY